MPFKNKAQMKACYAQGKSNPGSSWDCDKWMKETKAEMAKKSKPKKK